MPALPYSNVEATSPTKSPPTPPTSSLSEVSPIDNPTNYVDQEILFGQLQDKGAPFRKVKRHVGVNNQDKNQNSPYTNWRSSLRKSVGGGVKALQDLQGQTPCPLPEYAP